MSEIIFATSGLEYRWNGSLTVNVYRDDVEVDMFTLGAPDRATVAEFRASVDRRESCLAGEHAEIRDDGSCDYCGEQVEPEAARS